MRPIFPAPGLVPPGIPGTVFPDPAAEHLTKDTDCLRISVTIEVLLNLLP